MLSPVRFHAASSWVSLVSKRSHDSGPVSSYNALCNHRHIAARFACMAKDYQSLRGNQNACFPKFCLRSALLGSMHCCLCYNMLGNLSSSSELWKRLCLAALLLYHIRPQSSLLAMHFEAAACIVLQALCQPAGVATAQAGPVPLATYRLRPG